MRCDAIAIEELVLRMPGVRADEAPELVRAIMERVQERLRGSGRVGRIQLAELRVRVPDGAGRAAVIDQIADRLVEVLR